MNDDDFQIIGIDCAADPKNIGVAYAKMAGTRFTVERVRFGKGGRDSRSRRLRDLANDVVESVREADAPTLLAIDAPLGWPTQMSCALATHRAGEQLEGTGHQAPDAGSFFSRCTDRFVAEKTGKTPMAVGANLIARVSHTALGLLEMLRLSDGMPNFPHLLSQDGVIRREEGGLIEVYPALAGPFFLSSTGKAKYWDDLASALDKLKKDDDVNWFERLRQRVGALTDGELTVHLNDAVADAIKTRPRRDHGLDAILCAWTGFRFLQRRCVEPPRADDGQHNDCFEREGWIWFDKRTERQWCSAKRRHQQRLSRSEPAPP